MWAWNAPTGGDTAELDSTSHVVEETSGSGSMATTNTVHSELSNSTGSSNFESTLITSTNGSSTTTTTGYSSSNSGLGHMARVLTPMGTNGVSFAFGGLAAQNGSTLSVAPNISTGGQATSFGDGSTGGGSASGGASPSIGSAGLKYIRTASQMIAAVAAAASKGLTNEIASQTAPYIVCDGNSCMSSPVRPHTGLNNGYTDGIVGVNVASGNADTPLSPELMKVVEDALFWAPNETAMYTSIGTSRKVDAARKQKAVRELRNLMRPDSANPQQRRSRDTGTGLFVDVDGTPWELTYDEATDLVRSQMRGPASRMWNYALGGRSYEPGDTERTFTLEARRYRNNHNDESGYGGTTPLFVENAPIAREQGARRAEQFGRASTTISILTIVGAEVAGAMRGGALVIDGSMVEGEMVTSRLYGGLARAEAGNASVLAEVECFAEGSGIAIQENMAFDLRHLNKHLDGTPESLKLIARDGSAHVFPGKGVLGKVDKALFESGESLGNIRGWERWGLKFEEPIGFRIDSNGLRIPLHYGELKLHPTTGLYHIIPRTGPSF